MFSLEEHEQFGKFLEQASNATKAKPRKIMHWTDSMKSKLKKLYVKENRSIHSIARMMGGREYEIAEALERFGFAKEDIKLRPRPHPMKGLTREQYVPKWAREQQKPEMVTITAKQTMAATPAFGITLNPTPPKAEDEDPRLKILYNFAEQRDHYSKVLKELMKVDAHLLPVIDRVKHDLEVAKANELFTWFTTQYTQVLNNLAAKMTETTRWTDAK